MEKLPLFPLNTVLFPSVPISLHIFEERYKLMIGQCVARRQPFGVVLLKRGATEHHLGETAEPYPIGCSAVITRVQPQPGGRMNIVAQGKDRFRIHRLERDQPYLSGLVEWMPYAAANSADRERLAPPLRIQFERYIGLAAQFEKLDLDAAALPDDPLKLALLGLSLLKITDHQKQELLNAAGEIDVLSEAIRLLRREATLLEVLARPHDGANLGKYSVN